MAQKEELRQTYQSVIQAAKQLGVYLTRVYLHEGKLYVQGHAASQEAKNRLLDWIRMADPNEPDMAADIAVDPALASAMASTGATGGTDAMIGGGMQTYTVKFGDTLSKISKQVYGTSAQYLKIFEANLGEFEDPNKIMPGQTLKIPT